MKTLLVFALLLLLCPTVLAQSETPSKFEPTNHGFNYERRTVMIPMRDGVKLHTVILVPKGARNAPILAPARATVKGAQIVSHGRVRARDTIWQGA